MAFELKQSLRLSQQLVMTPQLRQAIKLLQLNRLELSQQVAVEMLDNPVLEEEPALSPEEEEEERKEAGPPEADGDKAKEVDPEKGEGTDDINWENYLQSIPYQPMGDGGGQRGATDSELPSIESTLTRQATLSEHLDAQVKLSRMSPDEELIAQRLIGSLDDDGYLRTSVEEVARKCRTLPSDVERVRRRLQEFDPLGVASVDLRECLLVQARQLPDSANLQRIISDHLKNLERKAYLPIARDLDLEMDEVAAAVRRIEALEPKPGRRFYDESMQYITPDIFVYNVGGDYVIALNEDGLPKLRISNFYHALLRRASASPKTKEYISEKLRSALWLIRSIHQRQRTIFKVTESIVKMQRDFLDRGVGSLRPMVLRDVAEDIGMHESTVSRVTSNKYIHTPQGIFELKFFFNSSIRRLEGADVASESVREKIKSFISSENSRRPYSDQELVELLRQSNIEIARRTVAKYRESAGILSSSKRRRLI